MTSSWLLSILPPLQHSAELLSRQVRKQGCNRVVGLYSGEVHSFVAILRLTGRVVEFVLREIVPWLCEVSTASDDGSGGAVEWFPQVDGLFGRLRRGMYSSGEECACSETTLCAVCERVPADDRCFVEQGRFPGLCPFEETVGGKD